MWCSQVLEQGNSFRMKALTFFILSSLLSGSNCTVLAVAGYIASASPVRNLLINSGISNVVKSSSDSLYNASGFRYRSDQGTDVRKAVMKSHSIVEIGVEDALLKRKSLVENSYSSDDRAYSERLFGVLNQMDRNTCIAKLLCEIGADPLSFGTIGLKIKHYVLSIPPVTWNSATFPYIEAFQAGLSKGKGVCIQHYSACTYDLNRVIEFLWQLINSASV